MLGAPPPRFRIYTRPSSYTALLGELIPGKIHDEESLEELEQEVSRRAGTKYAVCMPTARTGIYLTLVSLIKPGQKCARACGELGGGGKPRLSRTSDSGDHTCADERTPGDQHTAAIRSIVTRYFAMQIIARYGVIARHGALPV